MDLTKLPQELIFLHKESIDDYDIDDQLSADGILYDYLISQSFTVPIGWDKEKLILTMFNDANYLSTIIILDDRFTLHTHSWIDYYSMQWNDDSIVSVILRMVKFYLSCTIDLPSHVGKAVDSLISDFDRLKVAKASGIAMESHLMFISPTPTISCDHFKIMDIHNELLRYNTFKGRVNWGLITNKYNINDIIRVIRILGKDINSQISLIVDIDDSFHSSDYSINWELSQQIGILRHHLVDKGELLSKKELIEDYKKQKEIEEQIQNELFEQEMESHSSNQDEELKQKYEEQIDGLKQEISQLKEENALLKEQAEEKIVEEDNNGEGFTNAQMCALIYCMACISEEKVTRTKLAGIVAAIRGDGESSSATLLKGKWKRIDFIKVSEIVKEQMPKLAKEIIRLAPEK